MDKILVILWLILMIASSYLIINKYNSRKNSNEKIIQTIKKTEFSRTISRTIRMQRIIINGDTILIPLDTMYKKNKLREE